MKIALSCQIAEKFRDAYVGSSDDLKSIDTHSGIDYHHYEYETSQGFFRLLIPASFCVLINTESSVENIAHFIAETSKELTTKRPLVVRAFEGVGKGAIAKVEV